MAVTEAVGRRQTERRFFFAIAVIFPLMVLAGFGPTYYLRSYFQPPPLPSRLVHLHGLLMTGWVLLFMAQVWLISSRRVRVHQRLGMAGVALAAVLLPVGFLTAVAAAKYGSASFPPAVPPLVFMVVPMFDLVMFAGFLGAAIYYRRRPAEHKRLILLTVLNFLPPAIARWRVGFIAAAGPLAFFGIPDLLAILFVAADARLHGRVNRVFLAGTILLILSHPLRLVVGGTAWWLRFATWVTG